MSDITSFSVKGQPIEKVIIGVAGDTGLPALTVTFSTSTFTTKESALNALEKVRDTLQGWTWPPVVRS